MFEMFFRTILMRDYILFFNFMKNVLYAMTCYTLRVFRLVDSVKERWFVWGKPS